MEYVTQLTLDQKAEEIEPDEIMGQFLQFQRKDYEKMDSRSAKSTSRISSLNRILQKKEPKETNQITVK